MLSQVTTGLRFSRDLQGFLHQPSSVAECRTQLTRHLAERNHSFLRVVERGIYGYPGSPYRALLQAAGITLEHLTNWVTSSTIEETLVRLYNEGIFISLNEFKGRQPIQRFGQRWPVHDQDFDNPLLKKHYEAQTGGSRTGVGKRLIIDLDLLDFEASQEYLFLEAAGALNRPAIIWRPIPPGSAGMKAVLRRARIGQITTHWFSQSPVLPGRDNLSHTLFTWYAVLAGRVLGYPMPWPKYVALEQAACVAECLARYKALGRPAYFDSNVGSAVRVCMAAKESGLDIAGTVMRVGSESFTPAKAALIAETGCRALAHYAMSESSRIGSACGNPQVPDEVHVLQDKLALIQLQKTLSSGEEVGALFCSTVNAAAPKLMLNVELGDYGILLRRDCGCSFEQIGLHQHLHSIRSYEKLTTEGMHFVGADLIHLIEEVLPRQFGGNPTDYQLVEYEEQGLTKVGLIISPRVGPVDDAAVIALALQTLGAQSSGNKLMANYWRDGRTVQVVRREPYATRMAKIPPLHIIRSKEVLLNEKIS